MDGMLTSTEAAARLGVKVSTLYVYVSRVCWCRTERRRAGAACSVSRTSRHWRGDHGADDRSSPAWPWSPPRSRSCAPTGRSFRGRSAVEGLADGTSPEDVAGLLWDAGPGTWAPTPIDPPPGLAPRDRMPWTVVMVGAADPLRSDLRPSAVVRAARRLISTLATGPSVELPADAPWRSDSRRPARGRTHRHRWCARSVPPWCSWPTTNWPPRPWRCASPPRPGPTSTDVRRSPGSERWPDRCTGRRVDWCSTCCGGRVSTVPRLRSTTPEARAWCPASVTAHTPYGDPRHVALLEVVRDIVDDERRTTVDQVIALAADADLPAPNIDLALVICARHRHGSRDVAAPVRSGPLPRMGRPLHGGLRRGAAALPRPPGPCTSPRPRVARPDLVRSARAARVRGSAVRSLRTSPNRPSAVLQSSTAATISPRLRPTKLTTSGPAPRTDAPDQQPTCRPVGGGRDVCGAVRQVRQLVDPDGHAIQLGVGVGRGGQITEGTEQHGRCQPADPRGGQAPAWCSKAP